MTGFAHCNHSQLARVYLHAWSLNSGRIQAVIGNEFFRAIAEEIPDYMIRKLIDPAGGFYSTQDADSEGKEGKFFPAKGRWFHQQDCVQVFL